MRHFALLLIACVGLLAQTPPSQGASNANVPTAVLYRMFFQHVQFLSDRSDVQASAGKPDAALLRNHYQTVIGLTATEHEALRTVALKNAQTVKQFDNRAKAIIQAERAKYPNGRVPMGAKLPTPPDSLVQLNQQREDATAADIATLKTVLDAPAVSKIDNYIQTVFAKNITTNPLTGFKVPTRDSIPGAIK